MKNRCLHRLYGRYGWVRKIAMGMQASVELAVLGGHKDREVLKLIRRTRGERESLISGTEAFILHSLAKAQSVLPGEMAEVGVYQGCSAKLISVASGGRPLHLFDTFNGLPEPGAAETRFLRRNQYRSSLDSVRAYLSGEDNIQFHPGVFPGSAAALDDRRFAFVHLDVDLKSSTLACLDFFFPRMVPGGIIITHDYSFLDGVKQAFTEFLLARTERVIELPTSQALVVCHGGAPALPV